MPAAYTAERLIATRSEVSRACDLLIASSPETLDACQNALQSAVTELIEFKAQVKTGPDDAGVRAIAQGVRAEVLRAARLLESLAAFYHGWERILGALTAGYTASGNPAPITRQGRLCFRG